MNRLFTQFIDDACREIGATCDELSDGWVLRMQRGDAVHMTLGYGFDINNAASDRIGNDKAAQYALFRQQSIPAIAHHLARIPGAERVNPARIQGLPKDCAYVTKPVDGTGGDDTHLHPTLDDAVRYIDSLPPLTQSWVLSPHETLAYERRFIVLDDEILLAYEKSSPQLNPDGLVVFNLGKGAIATPLTPTQEETKLVVRAARACTLRLAAIDVVGTSGGQQKIMEINSGIMCENFAQQSDENFASVQNVYRAIVRRIFGL